MSDREEKLLQKLEEISERLTRLESRLDRDDTVRWQHVEERLDKLEPTLIKVREDIATLKVRAGIAGGLVGLISGAVTQLFKP